MIVNNQLLTKEVSMLPIFNVNIAVQQDADGNFWLYNNWAISCVTGQIEVSGEFAKVSREILCILSIPIPTVGETSVVEAQCSTFMHVDE